MATGQKMGNRSEVILGKRSAPAERRLKINLATFEVLTSPSLRLVAKVPFAAAPAAC
jgi:hypothetical protein